MPEIQTERQPSCPLCGSSGSYIHEDLRDGLWGAAGVWGFKACPECEALWLDPRPTPADIGKAYQSYFTHGGRSALGAVIAWGIRRVGRERAALKYGFGRATPGVGHLSALAADIYPGLADHLDLMARYLPASAQGEGRLLDVGCGDGEALEWLAALGWRASGVEVDPLAVKVARDRGLDVVQGDIHSAALARGAFDAVTSSHVLEHVHDPAAFLAEGRQLLKSGGTLVAVTPNTRAEMLCRHGRYWMQLDAPRHLVLFNADNLARLARQVGFTDVQVKKTARAVAVTHIVSSKVREDGRYVWNSWPGWRLWLSAQGLQARATRDVKLGRAEGEELVLIARK